MEIQKELHLQVISESGTRAALPSPLSLLGRRRVATPLREVMVQPHVKTPKREGDGMQSKYAKVDVSIHRLSYMYIMISIQIIINRVSIQRG